MTIDIPLIGYTDQLSARPGETISFKVSSKLDMPFEAKLFRSIGADPNPDGIGIVEDDTSEFFPAQSYPSQERPFFAGSYGISTEKISVGVENTLSLSANIFPTLRCQNEQTVLAVTGVEIFLTAKGQASVRSGGLVASIGKPLKLRQWCRLTASISGNGTLVILQEPLGNLFEKPTSATVDSSLPDRVDGYVSVAARQSDDHASHHFNGKIEAPTIVVDDDTVAVWDFSVETETTCVKGKTGPDLVLKNYPARAVTSSAWDGTEMCWRHKPAHYAAIHFHEDDIYDFNWDTDFKLTIPDTMPSGIYVMRIVCGEHEDAMPFFVAPPLGKPTSKLCILIPTFTYAIYGNHARPDFDPSWKNRMTEWGAYPYNPVEYPQYGLSTYNNHTDGSGICHASHKRPLLNLRPGYLTFGTVPCSGLRHFPADSHLISWLHAKDIDYDIVTADQLHRDGVLAIEKYAAVVTATHPEYHTNETLDALRAYRNGGGSLCYLGGNGFYWRIAQHCENDGMLEIRRAEDGIRAWAAEPGEYYNAFDGTYGGLWRRNGRAPQELVGIGFTAQGEFYGNPYHRTSYDAEYDWVFEGIEGNIIGDFGYSGNGAAGYELDRLDTHLGSQEDIVLLAQSQAPVGGGFVLAPEEQLTHITNLSGGPEKDVLRADMIYFEPPGGAVFSAGSITFCGSLPWNNFENNVSRLLENMITKMLHEK